MTVRVAVLTEDPAGPSARHRWAYPAPCFSEHGVELSLHPVQPSSARGAAFDAAAESDIVVIHRKLFRAPDLARLRRRARGLFVYDLDDAVMYRPTGRRRQWSFFRGLRFLRTVRSCSLFLAGNRYLVDRAPRRSLALLRPTPVDLSRYAPREDVSARGRVVGWIGTASTLPYLLGIGDALRELARRRKDLVLHVIGPEPPEVPGVDVRHVPWSEEGEAAALRSLDVGILPLSDDRWTRGKCAFKALQYMAAGLPVVASPVGMNVEAVKDRETGILATAGSEWVDALASLLEDAGTRERMGRAGRGRAEERYAAAVLTPRVARSFARLVE